jgi:squalene-associated FAD-dependent desaturase
MTGVVHVIGAGLAGLSAAVSLVDQGCSVILHEASRAAGGRCRSYYDATLESVIDNGNHLLLSGNRAALAYLGRTGGLNALSAPVGAEIPFADLATGERWVVHPNPGPVPWWILDARRRIPGSRPRDYLAPIALWRTPQSSTIGEVMTCRGQLYDRLWRPLLLAGLNTEPRVADARLGARLLLETLGRGGQSCRPLIAGDGLSATFVTPALRFLKAKGAVICFGSRLRRITLKAGTAIELDFGRNRVRLEAWDAVVLATPATVAAELVPGLQAPDAFHAIVNAHFRVASPVDLPPILGVLNGLTEWLFAYPHRLSVTISNADRLLGTPREELAGMIWHEVAQLTGLRGGLPPWQIVKERRATFAATPTQTARRPGARTRYRNLVLAGDWTATGLPATIEGAIRSGATAAAALGTDAAGTVRRRA